MNIIRTNAVELSTIPALTFKQKLLKAGGAGIKIIRMDQEATAVFTLDKRTGDPQPYGAFDTALFPPEAVEEAIELTSGLPYAGRGKLNISIFTDVRDEEDVGEADQEAIDMVGTDEYEAITGHYEDERGKLNYRLMNKEFIQFASKSKIVSEMLAAGEDEDAVIRFIIKNRAAFLAGKKESLSDREADALIETLDEIDPRSAFKELKAHLRRQMARR